MFDIDFINQMCQIYRFGTYDNSIKVNYDKIELRSAASTANAAAKSPKELTEEEIKRIKLALYLSKVIQDLRKGLAWQKKTDKEILAEIQLDFSVEALLMSIFPRNISIIGNALGGTPSDMIIGALINTEKQQNPLPMLYLQYTLSQYGKSPINITISKNILGKSITYDFAKLNNGNKIEKESKVYLEFQKRLRKKVETMIEEYLKAEKSEWKQKREEDHKKNMRIIQQYKSNSRISSETEIKGAGLFRLLIAAQGAQLLDFILEQRVVKMAIKEYLRSPTYNKIFCAAIAGKPKKK